jgi:hypothetical protein
MKKLYTHTSKKIQILSAVGDTQYFFGEELYHIFLKFPFPIKVIKDDIVHVIYSDRKDNDVVKKVHNVFVNGIEVKKNRWWQLGKREQ